VDFVPTTEQAEQRPPVIIATATWRRLYRTVGHRNRVRVDREDIMKALVYHGPGEKSWTDAPEPQIQNPTDVIVRIDTTTICGTDLHILKGDVPAVTPGRILGH
jgi:Alcohol dehydrogenase GroES-like domain